MVPSPWERRSFLRGMRQGGAFAREMSSGNQVRVGQWGATSKTCSSSSLSLHSVCASRLTGGNAYLRKARGQLCASAAVLSVRTSTCLPNSSGRNCRKAKCTAHSSRQLMCQSSQGPVQSAEAACPLHVAPQPVLEASVVTTVCRDTCSRGTPAHRKARSVQGLRERRHCWEIPTRSVPRRHAHLGSVASAEVVSYEAIRAAWLQLRMPYAPGASETVSVVPHSCLWRNSGSSALLGHVPLWGVPSYSLSLTPHREKRFSAQGRACSFPSWPEAPTGWGAGAPSPCDRPTALWIGLE